MVDDRKVPEGYKVTEVGVIPKDWDVQSLGTNSTLKARIGWQGLTTAEYLTDGEYYLITGTDFINGRIDWDNCYYVEKQRYEQDRNIQVRKKDILVTKDGTIGKVAFIDQIMRGATLNSGVFVIRPLKSAYEPEYLYHILMSRVFRDFLDRLAAGSTISHLYQKDFVHFEFPIPGILEQKAIAEALSDTDNLISSLEKLIDKKKKIKQGVMQQLLTGKKRLPGFSGDWEIKKLGEIARMQSGGTPRTEVKQFYSGNIPWASINDMTASRKYLRYTEKKITQEGLDKSSAVVFPEDTILYAMYASIGECVITKKEVSSSQAILGIQCYDQILCVEYLYYYLSFIKCFMRTQGQTGTQSNLNKNMVQNINITLPSIDEQKAIAQVLSDMDAEIEALEEKLEKYKTIKQGMMQELLTGRIRLI